MSGPAQATCSNTLSSACTRHFHTPLCVHNPTKDWLKYMTVMYVCLLAHAPQITLHCSPASCLNVSLLHMYSIWSHLHSCTVCILFYFLVYVQVTTFIYSICIVKADSRSVVYRFILFYFVLYICIYVAPWSCEARHLVPLYVHTCSGMTIKLNLTWLDLTI